jgi:hypothetical protein
MDTNWCSTRPRRRGTVVYGTVRSGAGAPLEPPHVSTWLASLEMGAPTASPRGARETRAGALRGAMRNSTVQARHRGAGPGTGSSSVGSMRGSPWGTGSRECARPRARRSGSTARRRVSNTGVLYGAKRGTTGPRCSRGGGGPRGRGTVGCARPPSGLRAPVCIPLEGALGSRGECTVRRRPRGGRLPRGGRPPARSLCCRAHVSAERASRARARAGSEGSCRARGAAVGDSETEGPGRGVAMRYGGGSGVGPSPGCVPKRSCSTVQRGNTGPSPQWGRIPAGPRHGRLPGGPHLGAPAAGCSTGAKGRWGGTRHGRGWGRGRGACFPEFLRPPRCSPWRGASFPPLGERGGRCPDHAPSGGGRVCAPRGG